MAKLYDQRKAYVNKAFGSQGLNLLDPSHIIREFQAREFNSATPTRGGFKSRYGFQVFNEDTSKTGGITMLHGFSKSDGTKELIFAHDDDYYFLTPSAAKTDAWTHIGDYGTAVANPTAYTLNDVVVFGTGLDGNIPYKYDSVTTTKTATTIAFADNNPDEITDSANGLGSFRAGDVVKVSGSTSNDGTYTIASVAAGSLTLVAGDSLTTEAAGDTVTLSATGFSKITTVASGATKDLAFFEFFQGQDFAALFGAGHPDNPSTLYYSDTDDPDTWSGGNAGAIDIAINDGSKITGLKAQGNQLIVYKERNRYYVSTFYESSAGVYGVRVSPFKDNAGGAIAHETIQVIKNGDILALATQSLGMQGIGKTQAPDGSLIPRDYSRDIRPLFEQINWSIASGARAALFDDIVWLAVPFGPSSTANNYVFRYHVDQDAWDVIPDLAISCWEVFEDSDGNEVLYAGSADSAKIYKFDRNVFTDNGATIVTVCESGLINLGSVFDMEHLQTIALKGFKQQGDTLKITVNIDGVDTAYPVTDTQIINASGTDGYLSMDMLSEKYLAAGSDSSGSVDWMAIILVPGSQALGREVKVRIENTSKAANWGTHHLSINEISPEEARRLPQKFVLVNQTS